jgi:hypothetical protein
MVAFRILDLTQSESRLLVWQLFKSIDKDVGHSLEFFDPDRWGVCEEAIVAEADGDLRGVVIFSLKGTKKRSQPTLDTLYISENHRGNGLGYSLLVRGIQRLIELGVNGKIFCDVISRGMYHLICRLPEDLASRLEVVKGFEEYDLDEAIRHWRRK